MSGIVDGLAQVLSLALRLYEYAVVIAVLLNLVNADPMNALVAFFRAATEPVFVWIRRRMPFVIVGGMDLSPLVVIAVIVFLQSALVGNLYRLAAH
jgi:YggT family protein